MIEFGFNHQLFFDPKQGGGVSATQPPLIDIKPQTTNHIGPDGKLEGHDGKNQHFGVNGRPARRRHKIGSVVMTQAAHSEPKDD